MSKKCSDVEFLIKNLAEETAKDDLNYKRIDDMHNTMPKQDPDPQVRKFFQALGDLGTSMINKIKKYPIGQIYTNREKYILREKQVKNLLAQHIRDTPTRERVDLVLKINSMIQVDPFNEALANIIGKELMMGVNFRALAEAGTPVKVHIPSGVPDISTLPLEQLRVIYGYLIEGWNGRGDEFIQGRWKTNLMFEFYLPKTVARKAGSVHLIKFMEQLYKRSPNKRGLINSVMNPSPHAVDIPREQMKRVLVHPVTGKPKIPILSRHMAGFNEFDQYYANMYQRLNAGGKNVFSNVDEVFKMVHHFKTGKAFMRVDPDHFGEVYMHGRDTQSPSIGSDGGYAKFPNGDIMFDWRGQDYEQGELARLRAEGKDIPYGWYVEPYLTESGEHVIFEKQHAEEFDTALQQNDDLNAEVMDVAIPRWQKIDTRGKALVEELTKQGRRYDEDLPHMLKVLIAQQDAYENAIDENEHQYVSQNINEIIDIIPEKWLMDKYNQTLDELLQLTYAKKLVIVDDYLDDEPNFVQDIRRVRRQIGWKNFTDKEGNIVVGRVARRYTTRQLHMSEYGNMMIEAIEKLDRNISALDVAAQYYPELGEDNVSFEDRNAAGSRSNDLKVARAGIREAYARFIHSDWINDPSEEIEVFKGPHEKFFRAIKHFISGKFERTDRNLQTVYIGALMHNITQTELLMDLAEAWVAEPNPALKDWMINKFKQSFNSLDAEGSFAGVRFSTRSFANALHLNPHSTRKFLLGLKRFLVTANLSNWTQGLQQLPSHVNKMLTSGYDKWLEARVDAQKEVNIKMMMDKGVFAFEDVIELMLLNEGDDVNREVHQRVLRDLKKDLDNAREKGDDGVVRSIQARLKKVKQTPQVTLLQKAATWAITGKVTTFATDTTAMKAAKELLRNMNPWSLAFTEKNLRSTTYMMGVNKYLEAGGNINDPEAHLWGMAFMNHTDMFLGTEGVGDNFGNDIMQFFNLVSVWRTQKMSYDLQTMKKTWMSLKPTDKGKIEGNATAMYDWLKYSIQTMSMPFLVGGGGAGGYAAYATMTQGINPMLIHSVGPLAAIALGGAAGYKMMDMIPLTSPEGKQAFRMSNPIAAKGIAEFWLHLGMSVGTNLILFSDIALNPVVSGISGVGWMVELIRKNSYQTHAGKPMSSLSSPLSNSFISMMIIMFKALSALDDEEEYEDMWTDFARGISSFTGIGSMFLLSLILSIFDNVEKEMPYKHKSPKDGPFEDFIDIIQPEVLEQVPLWDTERFIKESIREVERTLIPAKRKLHRTPN